MQTLESDVPVLTDRLAPTPSTPGGRPAARSVALQVPRQVLSFQVGDEEYGLDILSVQEIRSYEACTRIAGAADFVRGVVNLRGLIVPVFDLRLKLGLPTSEPDGTTVTIVLNVLSRVVGIVVDSVADVIQLGPSDVRPPPQFCADAEVAYITGIATVEQAGKRRMLTLVAVERLLSPSDLATSTC